MRSIGFLFISALMLSSCAAVSLNLDYDRGTDFSRYRTYTFNPRMESGLSELDQRRLQRLMDSVLQARGFERKLVADLLIDVRSEVFQGAPGPNVGIGIGGTNRNVGGGVSVGIPAGGSGLRRQLDIAFFDFTNNQVIWEAKTEQGIREDLTPDQREELLRKVVIKALNAYPPGK